MLNIEAKQSIFDSLTKYLSQLDTDIIGTWIIDRENDGTPEHPMQMPFVNYSELIHHFIEDVYKFNDDNKDFGLNRYGEVLEQNGLEWSAKSMSQADVSQLDARCVMALIIGAVRAERFCGGALLSLFEDGSIRRWLERLKEIAGGEV